MTEAQTFQLSPRGRTWMWVGIFLALLGVGLSVYSTHHHLELKAAGVTDAACNINATISCDEVAKSKFSEIGGIPLGIFGLGYFIAQLALIGIALKGKKSAREHLFAYAALVLIGVAVSVSLGAISITQIGAACLTCIAIYLTCLLQAGALFAYRREIPAGFNAKDTVSGGLTAMIVVAAVVGAFNALRPSLMPKPLANQTQSPTDPKAPQLALKAEDIKISRSAYAGLGEDYRRGPDTAKVQIVEFADFQCPACAQVKNILHLLEGEYKDKLQVVYRNFPLDSSCNSGIQGKMHEFSCHAAIMARCAGQYGKFWELHGVLFDRQREMSDDKIKAWAKEIAGLNDDQIKTCWDSKDLLAKVKDDIAEANRLNINSTPTLFINGRKATSHSINDLRQSIDQQLQ